MLGGSDVAKDVAALAAMGVLPKHVGVVVDADDRAHGVTAIVDALEVKASTLAEIAAIRAAVPPDLELFVEVPVDPDPAPLLIALASAHAGAKIRTGGVTANAIPPSSARRSISHERGANPTPVQSDCRPPSCHPGALPAHLCA